MFKKLLLWLIKFYQLTISPDHGYFPVLRLLGQCRHYPTCSEYTYQAIARHGIIKGLGLGMKRLSTCHPWAKNLS